MIAFGPIPSRRLGQSLGINNIPLKSCSYDCLYCQVGPTTDAKIERRPFYAPAEIVQAVKEKLQQADAACATVDYLSFVPDGEPTLDLHLGQEIDLLRPLRKKIAVFTNGTLLWRADVQAELARADWVSVKVDAVQEETWRQINRPSEPLSLPAILEGMRSFARLFRGTLTTETMLVRGINDDEASVTAVASLVSELAPAVAYLAVPTRPPSERWVQMPDEETLHRAYQIFAEHLDRVEYLLGFAEQPFRATGNVEEGLLAITSVHPMREEEALAYLEQAGRDRGILDTLIVQGKLLPVTHRGQRFLIRRLSASPPATSK
jgi:wyosine [tRNA(Phe)-imidazoG37] synthetase (radical SAM superfamily)